MLWSVRARRPSHATVVAYLALFVALGGSAYAITRIDSGEIVNDSLKSKDLKDGKAVAGRDLRQDTLTGAHIRESRLDASQFSAFAAGGGGCSPSPTPTPCGEASISLETASTVLAIVDAGFSSPDAPASVICELAFDGAPAASTSVGQDTRTHMNGVNAEGFAFSGLSQKLTPGQHQITVACSTGGEAQVSGVRISAIALGSD